MRYFTPELYLGINSKDETEASNAETSWEVGVLEYGLYLDGIKSRLPHGVRDFLKNYCLHDAIFANGEFMSNGNYIHTWNEESGNRVSLMYNWTEMKSIRHRGFDGYQFKLWLYDEIHEVGDRVYEHSILLNGGVERIIRFTDMNVFRQIVQGEVVDDPSQCNWW